MQSRPRTRTPGVGTARIVGVDTARGLAVLGMFVAHLGMERHTGLFTPTGWFFLGDGRPSALFAMLAGIGLVFMTRRAQHDPDRFAFQRSRIIRRAVILYFFGYGLMFLGTPVAVILPAYAVLFILALPFLRMTATSVLIAAGVVLAVGPQLLILTRHAATGAAGPVGGWAFLPGLAEVWAGYYPVITWLAYILVGIAVGKTDLRSPRTATVLLAAGSIAAAVGYGAGAWAKRWVGGTEGDVPFDLVSIEPHANTTPEMLGNAGFAVAVLGLCLLAMTPRVMQVLAAPLNAVGSMSLTIYSLHIVYIAILGTDAVWYPVSNQPLLWLTLGSLIFALGWQVTLGQGPLERLLQRLITPRSQPQPPPAGHQHPPWPVPHPHPGHQHPPAPPSTFPPAPPTSPPSPPAPSPSPPAPSPQVPAHGAPPPAPMPPLHPRP